MSQAQGVNAYNKPVENDFEYVYAENKDKGFIKVTKSMLKVILGVATKLSELENDKEFVDKTVTSLENYYLKKDTYSKEELDNKLSLVPRFSVQVVSTLPNENISETTVYLVPAGEDEDNLYTEYINVNGLWEILGTQKIAKFEVTKEDVENALGYTPASETKVGQLEKTVNGMNLSEYETKSDATDKFNTLTNTKAPIVHKHFWSDINDRPFGEDFVTEIIADEQTPELYDSTGVYASGGLVVQNEPEPKISGETYVVTIDGTAYTCASWIDAGYDYNTTFIGDSRMWGETEDNVILETNPENVPFLIEFYFIEKEDGISWFPETILDSVSIYFPDATPRTVKIEKKSDEVIVKQIDEKFIPDTIARTEDLRELSETVNDLKQNGTGTTTLIEPMEDDIPKVFIDGVIPTTKDDVLAEMTYKSKTDEFHAYLKIKCQGTSSMSYDKKNFTIKMYSDETRETKLKKAFKDWGSEQNKYVLKANYIDHSHARNIVSARLWGEVVASRSDYDSLPMELKTSPNNGAIDGFPIKVYTNGTYQGLYTWNIGKDDWLFNMDEDNPNHVLLCAETNTDGVYSENPCNFRALWSGVHEQNWSVEVGTNSDAVKNSLNALIGCVMNTDDETFMATIEEHLNVQSAIDYYIQQYVTCGIDNLAKNMLLATYNGVKWYCSSYDMDSTFGLTPQGATDVVTPDYACPEQYKEQFSLLWERIVNCYFERIKTRYFELRKTVFSFSNMVTKFERFMDVIGLDLFEEDAKIYPVPSKTTNNIQYIRDFIRDRLVYTDEKILELSYKIECEGISLDRTELVFSNSLSVQLNATVTPVDTTDAIVWESSDETVAIVRQGLVTPLTAGECIITATCGNYIADCNVTVQFMSLASQITWKDGYCVLGSTGEEKASDGDSASDFVNLCGAKYMVFGDTGNVNSGAINGRVQFYDINKKSLGYVGSYTITYENCSVMDGAMYARFTIKTANKGGFTVATDVDLNGYIKLDADKFIENKKPSADGEIAANGQGYYDEFIPVAEGDIVSYINVADFFREESEIVFYDIGYASFDSDKNYISLIEKGGRYMGVYRIPEGVSYIKFIAHNTCKDYRYYKVLG